MIHVNAQPEPSGFDVNVRQKGIAYLRNKKIALDKPIPPKTEIYPYWRDCLDDLYSNYQGICAYLAVYFERVTGGGSIDHFIPKSKRADLAYEWCNYRLACSIMNCRKRDYEDVLDPFEIEDGWCSLILQRGGLSSTTRAFPAYRSSGSGKQPGMTHNSKHILARCPLPPAGSWLGLCQYYFGRWGGAS
jgi:hypothetical protein